MQRDIFSFCFPLRLVLFLCLLVVGILESPAQAQNALKAGAAAIDVTPKIFPLNMPGGFRENLAESAHDALSSRALVLDDGRTRLAMVVVDNLGLASEVIVAAKKIAADATKIPAEKMLICSTHTHSAPSSNVKKGRKAEVAYRQVLIDGIAKSIVEANSRLQPAAFATSKAPLPDEVFNRRWYLKPGKMPLNPFGEMDSVKMNPGYSETVLDRPAGPTDPDITIISIQDAKRRPLSMFANYSLHYVGAIPRGQVSADYFGEFARLMPYRLRGGKDFVAMMSNGTSGDINNLPFLVNRPPRAPFEQVKIVATKAADTAWRAYRKIEKHKTAIQLGMLEREIVLKHRKISPEQLAEAKRIAALKDPKEIAKLPRLAQAYARRTISLAAKKETVTVTLQAIRIGDLAVCGIPFETLVEIGLELKQDSPFKNTMVIGLANGRYGYLPTPRQHRLGGYETWLGTNQVQKDASVMITKHLLSMLSELKKK